MSIEWSPCKLCDALDFFRPEIVAQIRRFGEEPRFHSKQWEWAQLLETRRRLAPNAKRLIGLGVANEPALPLVGEGAEEVIATDIYGADGVWEGARRTPDETYPDMRNLRVHSMDMRAIDLPERSADFVWSECAIGQVGDADAVVRTISDAGKLLKPDGILFLSYVFTFGDAPSMVTTSGASLLILDRKVTERLFADTGLHLAAPLDLRISDHPFNAPLARPLTERYPMLPHVTLTWRRSAFRAMHVTSISVALCGEDRGCDRVVFDEGQRARLTPMIDCAQRVNRRLTLPHQWLW